MNDAPSRPIKIYVTDRPRAFGLFHFGPAVTGSQEADRSFGVVGVIGHIGPCRCGNPAHTFPQWYSLTPCLYVRIGGDILTCRIPAWLGELLV